MVQAGLAPAASLACDRALLAEAGGVGAGCLRVYDLTGRLVSLGRYHRPPEAGGQGGVAWLRRYSGGRAAPHGAGFLGVALVMPHRSAPFAADPLALAPEQVLNRHVRGLLDGLRLAGVDAYYPGRDVVTVGGRVVALVSFAVEPSGAFLFEAILAVEEDFACLPARLDAIDPAGVVTADLVSPDAVTSVARVRGGGTEELAGLLVRGYEARLGMSAAPRDLTAVSGVEDPGWRAQRTRAPALDRHAMVRGQIGVLEVFAAVEAGRVGEVMLAGDPIAPAETIAALERALRGCPCERGAIDAAVRAVLADPARFVLGLGPVTTITDAVARAVGA